MGCNIYLHVEKKVNGQWTYVGGDDAEGKNDYYDGGRYVVFSRLAGVRNDEGLTPLAGPRGLPDQTVGQYTFGTWRAKYTPAEFGPDERVTSWLTLAELEQQDWEQFSREWNETDFSIGTMTKLRELADGQPGDVRIVFWFDDTIADVERCEAARR